MRISFCPPRHEHARLWLGAMREGIARHEPYELVTGLDCDFAIFWGYNWQSEISHLQEAKKNFLIMEQGFIGNRPEWCSLGWNGLNGRATFAEVNDPSRFDRYFSHLLQPWKDGGNYALIMGQVPGDMAVRGVNLARWYSSVAASLAARGFTVRYRPHPYLTRLGGPATGIAGVKTLDGSIEAALRDAKTVVTFNSTSAVDAVLSGVPAVSFDEGSMAYEVTGHSEDDCFYKPERSAYAARLAWKQFTIEEVRLGFAWEVVSQVIK